MARQESDDLDDGRVIGHVLADDVKMVEQVDHNTFEESDTLYDNRLINAPYLTGLFFTNDDLPERII